ncbi:MAG: hypothetical protein JWN04_6240 [Myxococcaceae bacterium]|nr:hypothetical protein [Myxococcaceae bacterium]
MLFTVCKILHVLGNVLWIGGGAASAFAFVLLAHEDEKVRLAGARALRTLTLTLVTPGFLLSISAGLIMLLTFWSEQYAKAPWMHVKLTLGIVAAAFSGVLSGRLRRAAAGSEVSPGSIRLAGSILLLSGIVNVVMVYTRLGQH